MFVSWVVVGLLAGWLAGFVMKNVNPRPHGPGAIRRRRRSV